MFSKVTNWIKIMVMILFFIIVIDLYFVVINFDMFVDLKWFLGSLVFIIVSFFAIIYAFYCIERTIYIDDLTKLNNMKYLKEMYPFYFIKHNNKVNLILIDFRKLKYINDRYGHEEGDICLIHFSKLVKKYFVGSINLRRSGDEFIIATNKTYKEIKKTFEKMKLEVSSEYENGNIKVLYGMNVGVKNAESISSLDSDLSCADISMYCAKENNKLIVKYKPELKINYMKKVDRSVDFFEALENDDFMFYFQPVYKSDNSIDSLELFIRWNFQGEIVSSKELYNMIEGANKKEMLDSYVVKKACNFVHDNNFKVRINIDHISIMYNNDELINYLEETVISFGIDKKNIILEFGFDEMIDDVLLFKEKIENIRKLGFKVSISEKSNSYILLPYLYLIDFDEVKISEYLIDNSLTSIKIRFLLDNILKYIKMSNSDLVFAEISKESTYRFVRALNLDCYYQGYYLAEPNSYEKIAKKLLK